MHQCRGILLLAALLVMGACGPTTPAGATLPTTSVAPTSAATPPSPTLAPTSTLAPAGLHDCQLLDPPGRCASIDVGGYNLWLVCRGTGSPTIILDAGFGDDSQTWDRVISPLSTVSHACVYDRAGLGSSDAPPAAARTSGHIVTDLHTLLTRAAIPGPYVLVGHSFGGLNVRVFADQYPDLVSGLVLVDASSPGQDEQFAPLKELLPPATPRECPEVTDLRTGASLQPAGNPEHIDALASLALVAPTQDLGALPLAVLTAGRAPEGPACVPPEYLERTYAIWRELQAQLPKLSTNSAHIMATASGHYIQLDEPDLVVDAIRQVVAAARSGGRVAGSP